ncbi:unnamed protein product [Prunus armeniaca]
MGVGEFSSSLLLFASILLQYLAVGALPGKLPKPCLYLSFLSINISFGDPFEVLAAQCLLRSSPALQELLSSSPLLERLTIKPAASVVDSSELLKRLIRFRRASVLSEIVYLEP